jgi:hypothetical protein
MATKQEVLEGIHTWDQSVDMIERKIQEVKQRVQEWEDNGRREVEGVVGQVAKELEEDVLRVIDENYVTNKVVQQIYDRIETKADRDMFDGMLKEFLVQIDNMTVLFKEGVSRESKRSIAEKMRKRVKSLVSTIPIHIKTPKTFDNSKMRAVRDSQISCRFISPTPEPFPSSKHSNIKNESLYISPLNPNNKAFFPKSYFGNRFISKKFSEQYSVHPFDIRSSAPSKPTSKRRKLDLTLRKI